MLDAGFPFGLVFDFEGESDMFLRNISYYTALYLTRQNPSYPPL
jgi:hypothetical protein